MSEATCGATAPDIASLIRATSPASSRQKNPAATSPSMSTLLGSAAAACGSSCPGLVPGIHVFGAVRKKDVDGRGEPGKRSARSLITSNFVWVAAGNLQSYAIGQV